MDEIQRYTPHNAIPSPMQAASATLAINPAAVKTPSNYLKAVRRRVWVVLAIGVPIAILACIYVLHMPPVYQVKAEIEINPPEYDPALATLVSKDIGRRDGSQERYIPNRAAMLKSARLLERVVIDPLLQAEIGQYEDPAAELFRSLTFQPTQRNGNTYIVSLEGNDPARTKKLLERLLWHFQKVTKKDNEDKITGTMDYAKGSLDALVKELGDLDQMIVNALKVNSTIGPGGKSIIEERYVGLGTIMLQKQMRLGDLYQQMKMSEMFPKSEMGPEAAARAGRIAQLELEKRKDVRILKNLKKSIRNFDNDPAAIHWGGMLDEVLDELEELRAIGNTPAPNAAGMILDQYQRELEADKEEHGELLKKMQETLPAHQKILTLMDERRDKARRVSDLKTSLTEFDILSHSLIDADFVKIQTSIVEPTTPVRPNKPMMIVISLVLSFGVGIGLVCLLEHIDHSVKVPEHASHGLTLPLLGVVPRIRRTALTQRGRHLWTPGAVGVARLRRLSQRPGQPAGRRRPQRADRDAPGHERQGGRGEEHHRTEPRGHLRLAGERTLLLDVDFRRPTLAEVFIEDEDWRTTPGVVDVLRGEIPWQRTLRHTRIPNLDFIPTGDTRETPIEILGTLELRQFLAALAHHYDRVILDGPAVLGLADCRFLGRIVNASMLVVRSGSHHLMTLHRAKAMLEQSHVTIAGVVFNGLTEDLQHWSSYGYGDEQPAPDRFESARTDEEALSFSGRS